MGADEFFERKGINEDTLVRARVSVGVDGRINFPYRNGGYKVRYNAPDYREFRSINLDRELWYLPGTDVSDCCFLVEGETDALKLWQEYEYKIDVYALSGVENNPDLAELASYRNVFVVLDNDEGYAVQSTDRAWKFISSKLSNSVRVKLPEVVNDLCDFFLYFGEGHVLLSRLVEVALDQVDNGTLHFTPLDLSVPPGPIDWVLEGYLAKGDIALLAADPGVGKSMWAMGLSVAVAEGHPRFMGMPLTLEGPVLYVDEENPEDVARRRLEGFSTNGKYVENIRYLSHQGVRLDRNQDKLIEEARAFKPALVVLDSFIRFHGKEENDSGAMSTIFNDGIAPLSRKLGATVVVLHHTNKMDTNDTYKAVRGSGDIMGAPDAVLRMFEMDATNKTLGLVHGKGRRGAELKTRRIQIVDTDTGLAIVHSPMPEVFG